VPRKPKEATAEGDPKVVVITKTPKAERPAFTPESSVAEFKNVEDLPPISGDLRAKPLAPATGPIKAVGMRKAGNSYVAYELTIVDGKVVAEHNSEVNLRPIVLDMARTLFVDAFMGDEEATA